MASLGEQIQTARKAKGLTQDALARAINVTRQTISNYESGKRLPDVSTLMLLSKTLDFHFMNPASADNPAKADAEKVPADKTAAVAGADSAPTDQTEAQAGKNSAQADQTDAPAGADCVTADTTDAGAERSTAETAGEPQTKKPPAEAADPVRFDREPSSDSAAPRTSARPTGWKRLLPLMAAVVILAAALLIWKPWRKPVSYTDSDGVAYTIADFKQTAENDASKAYLLLVPSFQFMKNDADTYWLYSLNCYETNHIALSVDRYEEFIFKDNKLIHRVSGQKDLEPLGVSTAISADGEWVITGGFPTQNVKGVGWKITTTDANSATETFTCFLPLAEQ